MKKHIYLISFVLFTSLVITMSSIPDLHTPHIPDKLAPDKIAHFIQYFIFAFLYYKFRASRGFAKKEVLIELTFLGIMISIANELYQTMIPGRTFSWWDAMANLSGFAGFIIIFQIKCYFINNIFLVSEKSPTFNR